MLTSYICFVLRRQTNKASNLTRTHKEEVARVATEPPYPLEYNILRTKVTFGITPQAAADFECREQKCSTRKR